MSTTYLSREVHTKGWTWGDKFWDSVDSTFLCLCQLPSEGRGLSTGLIIPRICLQALRVMYMVQTQHPCQNWLSTAGVGLWQLRHTMCSGITSRHPEAHVRGARSVITWIRDRLEKIRIGNLTDKLLIVKTQLAAGNLAKTFKSDCLSGIGGKDEYEIQARKGREVVEAGNFNGALRVSTWCRVCEFRLPRLQSSVAKARCGYRQTDRKREKRRDPC